MHFYLFIYYIYLTLTLHIHWNNQLINIFSILSIYFNFSLFTYFYEYLLIYHYKK